MSTKDADGRLVELLSRSRRMMIFTGAGISTGSGIPDYRGPDGVWKTRRPVEFHDFLRSEAARVEYWEWKLESRAAMRSAQPNATHRACARLEQAGRLQAVVTQNIDGLHEKAGTSRARLVELHGTEARVACLLCGGEVSPDEAYASFEASRQAPRCGCGGFLKPATISFGQALRVEDLQRAEEAAEACDLVVSLGSTLSVHPAAGFPLLAARRGVPYAIVNRGVTEHDGLPSVTLRLEGDVAALFPPAVERALAASA
ncbi:MAG: Sir2 family NAD-dependent protein deacetylase [Deltaproteobacteria bacterium]|nr:Sir2 family NAD-dependent protein deacetylase [Deltaproteobacteria bacterium]